MDMKLRSRAGGALWATLLLGVTLLTGCSDVPAGPAANGNQTAANQAGQPAQSGQPQAPNSNAVVTAPLGMEDVIEGRVIDPTCLREKPAATPEELAACTKANDTKGGILVVLAADGTVYFNDKDLRVTRSQLGEFIGQEVTIQGKLAGDAPELGWAGVTAKRFKMGPVRRKGSGNGSNKLPTGKPTKVEATPKGQ